jgi:hypothetical protein
MGIAEFKDLERYLTSHEAELIDDVLEELPAVIRVLGPLVVLENDQDAIHRWLMFEELGRESWLEIRPLSYYEVILRSHRYNGRL